MAVGVYTCAGVSVQWVAQSLPFPLGSKVAVAPPCQCLASSRGWQQGMGPPAGAQQRPDLCPHDSQVEATEPQDVVVYDQSTRDASVLAADSFLSILLSKLDGCFDSVAILTGELRTGPRQGLWGSRLSLSSLQAGLWWTGRRAGLLIHLCSFF